MKDRWAKRRLVQELLIDATKCSVQHTGWPCNTCFHFLETKLPVDGDTLHAMWHAVLILRGDYRNGEDGLSLTNKQLESLVDGLLELLMGQSVPTAQVH